MLPLRVSEVETATCVLHLQYKESAKNGLYRVPLETTADKILLLLLRQIPSKAAF